MIFQISNEKIKTKYFNLLISIKNLKEDNFDALIFTRGNKIIRTIDPKKAILLQEDNSWRSSWRKLDNGGSSYITCWEKNQLLLNKKVNLSKSSVKQMNTANKATFRTFYIYFRQL